MSQADRFAQRLEFVSPLTAVIFSGLCWLVFSVLNGERSVESLPELTRQFLRIQPWWLAAGAIGFGISTVARLRGDQSNWKRIGPIYALMLAAFNVFNIGWGIIAIYLLILSISSV